jgi:hypothetical protein
MTTDANPLSVTVAAPGMRSRILRVLSRKPDTEMLLALWKGIWSTVFTILTLSALIFVCVHEEPRPGHDQTVHKHG